MISIELDTSASLCSDADLFTLGASEPAHTERVEQLATKPFFHLPEQQLEQYAERRGGSDLGRIFHIANGLHEHIDAIVVLGSRRSTLAIRGLMQACCDPYHNELSRAQRGCKPRVYFAGDGYDNDATASLLERLRTVDEDASQAERRFGILLHLDDQAEPAITALPCLVDCLKAMLTDRVAPWLSRLVIPIVPEGASTGNDFAGIQPRNQFQLTHELQGEWNALSPATLLPAAFLGLDCMKLLEGATAMNENFRTAPFAENFVWRYESTGRCWAARDKITEQEICVWEHSLRALQDWAKSLSTRSQTAPAPQPDPSPKTCSVLWRVRSHRTDPVFLPDDPQRTHHDQLSSKIDQFKQSIRSRSLPTIDLTLPAIEPFVLGQLMQAMMISSSQ